MDHEVLKMYGNKGPSFPPFFSLLWSSKSHQWRDQNQIHSIQLFFLIFFFLAKKFIFLLSFTCIHFFSSEIAKLESYLSTLLSLFVLMLRVRDQLPFISFGRRRHRSRTDRNWTAEIASCSWVQLHFISLSHW